MRKRIDAFRYAVKGIGGVLRTQPNAWIHAFATGGVVAAGAWFGLGRTEWLWIVAAICAVWTAEAFNTSLELLADAVSQERRPLIGKAKDVGAAAVLFAAAGAAVIGGLVFWPHIHDAL